MDEAEPQTRVHEPQGPWAPPHQLRDLTSPEYLAIEKLVGWLANNTVIPGLAHLTQGQIIDIVIQILESSRKLTMVTYESLEPRMRKLIRQVLDEEAAG